MTSNFKKLSQEARNIEPRAAIPQVDPEALKPTPATPVAPAQPSVAPRPADDEHHDAAAVTADQTPSSQRPVYITQVETDELPTNRGFAMYPSRHTQLVRDLTFVEGRRPWLIIEDALEEYVVKHYGKQHKRK